MLSPRFETRDMCCSRSPGPLVLFVPPHLEVCGTMNIVLCSPRSGAKFLFSMFLRSYFPCSEFLQLKVRMTLSSCWLKVPTTQSSCISELLLIQSSYRYKISAALKVIQFQSSYWFKVPTGGKFLQVRLDLGSVGQVGLDE
jgi:hypothetical protein